MTYRFEIRDMAWFENKFGKIPINYYGKDGKE
jgi:hypothetical protein